MYIKSMPLEGLAALIPQLHYQGIVWLGCCYLSTNFCPSSVKKNKISDFRDLNPGPKSRLQSLRHFTTTPPPP
jgi:hypothetical protein